MAKYTVLDMTQNILSALSSDEVNSISDTVESMQVAQILKNTFNNVITRAGLPEHNELFQLDPSLDLYAPVLMYVPDNVSKLEWVKYFNSNTDPESTGGDHDINVDITPSVDDTTVPPPGYIYVTVLPIGQFLDMTASYNPTESDVESFTFSNQYNGIANDFTFYYKNSGQPSYCTVISNKYVVFDSYDATQDSTLQSAKTMCWGQVVPVFKLEDSFIPDLDDQQFPLLINEAKSLAFFEMKQIPHPKAEQESKRQWSAVSKNKATIDRPTYFDSLPNYGRGGRGFARSPNFR